MRSRRRTPRGGVQAEKQQQYVRLIAQGVNNSEACRIVGINRKTGNRWRYGRSVRNSAGARVHYAPVRSLGEAAQPAVSLRAGAGADRRPAGREDDHPWNRGGVGATRRRRSAASCAATVILMGAIARITLSMPPVCARANCASGVSRLTGCSPRSLSDCWASAGALSRSPTSCAAGSPAARSVVVCGVDLPSDL